MAHDFISVAEYERTHPLRARITDIHAVGYASRVLVRREIPPHPKARKVKLGYRHPSETPTKK